MTHAVVRPVREDDVDGLVALAKTSDGGMTNLPPDPKVLAQRVERSVQSFAKDIEAPGDEVYMMVLERDGEIIGATGVFAAIGLEEGFINYRINTEVHVSHELDKRFKRQLLVPTHDFTGASEVAMLFLSPNARGGGFGKLLARVRYLLMAQSPERFSDTICGEIRGWREADGARPVWDALGARFFDMEFEQADRYNAAFGNQFIADLMPRHPIYVCLLSKAAQKALGQPHKNARPAYEMLVKEGFEYTGYVDIFDGGPVLHAKLKDVDAVKNSRPLRVQKNALGPEIDSIVAAGTKDHFRTVRAKARVQNDAIFLPAEAADVLNVAPGDVVRQLNW
ncbi:MAG: arginine N-succinyltransferase [Pseudomonadota bacterium]